jgi:hypothetical protein
MTHSHHLTLCNGFASIKMAVFFIINRSRYLCFCLVYKYTTFSAINSMLLSTLAASTPTLSTLACSILLIISNGLAYLER